MGKSETKRLVRIPSQGKIAGVCAGVAEYTGMEAWLVRIIWFTGFIFSGGFFFVAYIAAWFILDKDGSSFKRSGGFNQGKGQWQRFGARDIDEAVEVKSKVWQAGEPPKMAYKDIIRQFEGIEARVIDMESYVTSNRFTLKREINNL
jgi:phage shock protein C